MSYRSTEEWVASLRAQTKKGGVPVPGAIGGGIGQDLSKKTYAEPGVKGSGHEDIARIIANTSATRCDLPCADLNWGFMGRGINPEDYAKWMADYAVAARQFHIVGDNENRDRMLQDADCLKKYYEACLPEKVDLMKAKLKQHRREEMDPELRESRKRKM